MKFLHSLLGTASFYQLAMSAIGGPNPRKVHISRYIRPQRGDRILDVGCGPADIIESLPDVSYLGIDISPQYIEAARKNYGNRASFICQDVTKIDPEDLEPFDIVLATGLLHHLSDAEAITLLCSCRSLLKPYGRMITFDGCRTEKQHPFDTWMLNNDRGEFVRYKNEYVKLASTVFPEVRVHVHSDLLRIPYTLAIMELTLSSGRTLAECSEKENVLSPKVRQATSERESEP